MISEVQREQNSKLGQQTVIFKYMGQILEFSSRQWSFYNKYFLPCMKNQFRKLHIAHTQLSVLLLNLISASKKEIGGIPKSGLWNPLVLTLQIEFLERRRQDAPFYEKEVTLCNFSVGMIIFNLKQMIVFDKIHHSLSV